VWGLDGVIVFLLMLIEEGMATVGSEALADLIEYLFFLKKMLTIVLNLSMLLHDKVMFLTEKRRQARFVFVFSLKLRRPQHK
tara:strand:+ start:1317 stop:1562 length:246 start_codon:yes stop_codon:yes gene_type:complete